MVKAIKDEEKENDANDERQRKVAEKKERRDRERDSEKPKKSSSIKLPEPRTGILDGIKKFMSNVITGFLLIKLVTLTPLLQTVSRLIAPVGKFLYEFGKKLLDIQFDDDTDTTIINIETKQANAVYLLLNAAISTGI